MTTPSPLINVQRQADASFIRYADAADVVETFGHLELEYAAIRKSAALIDLPHLATLRVTGDDRLDFLNRMLTQQLESLQPWNTARAFLIGRQGRLIADLTLIHTPEQTLVETDILAAETTLETLEQFLFSENVSLENATPTHHTIALHGPTAGDLLAQVSTPDPSANAAPPIEHLQPAQATRVLIADRPATIHRQDLTASHGFFLTVATTDLGPIHESITAAGIAPDHDHVEAKQRGITHPFNLRPIGWHALNIARIEAGTPLFNIDFAQGNLPAETGVLHDRVSFTKGCYPGQEVVARMHNLGHPKQVLVALRITPGGTSGLSRRVPPKGSNGPAPSPDEPDFQPLTGAAIIKPGAPTDGQSFDPVGAVTSSTRSPMLSDAIICFAQLRWDSTRPGTTLDVLTPAGHATAVVQQHLRFWPTPGDG